MVPRSLCSARIPASCQRIYWHGWGSAQTFCNGRTMHRANQGAIASKCRYGRQALPETRKCTSPLRRSLLMRPLILVLGALRLAIERSVRATRFAVRIVATRGPVVFFRHVLNPGYYCFGAPSGRPPLSAPWPVVDPVGAVRGSGAGLAGWNGFGVLGSIRSLAS
jgi:hypothetical protein